MKLDEEYIQSNGVRQVDRAKLIETQEAIQGSHVIRAKYVLGCDGMCSYVQYHHLLRDVTTGAHSWVRQAVNISLEGEMTGDTSNKINHLVC